MRPSLIFQLHHTGIKTEEGLGNVHLQEDFNCTIQELKHTDVVGEAQQPLDFNCTIQELKPNILFLFETASFISIAPYRN